MSIFNIKEDVVCGSADYSNLNLLDNWHFTINQKNDTSGTTTYNTYSMDRWKWDYTGSAGTFSQGARSVTVTPSAGNSVILSQPIENAVILDGKVLTASILLYNENLYSGTITRANGTAQTFFTKDSNPDGVEIRFGASGDIRVCCYQTKTIMSVKLELGNASTLKFDPDPKPQQELAKCQRFFYRLKSSSSSYLLPIGVCAAGSATAIRIPIHLPIPMRASPSISASANNVLTAVNSGGTTFTSTGVSAQIASTDFSLRVIDGNFTGLTSNNFYFVRLSATGYIDFDSNL